MTLRDIAAVMPQIEIRTHNKIAIFSNMFGGKMELKNPVEIENVTTKKQVSEDPRLNATIDQALEQARKRKKREVDGRGR